MENSNKPEGEDRPEMSKQERLRKLYKLSDDIVDSALGKDKRTKRKLYRLRDRVIAEIKQLEKEREQARERYFAKIRAHMDEVGFVPSGKRED